MRGPGVLAAVACGAIATPVVASGCIGGVPHCCAIVAPARYDVGVLASDRGTRGAHLALGMSWASFAPTPDVGFDVGVGYVIDIRGDEPGSTAELRGKPTVAPSVGDVVWGGYLETGARLGGGRRHRAFVSLRGEIVREEFDDIELDRYGVGITGRLAWEVVKVGRGSTWMGALGAGVFVEATARRYGSDVIEHTVVTGISVRVPMKFIRTR